MKIEEILRLNTGAVIDKIEGECTAVYTKQSGRSAKGPWTKTPIKISDGVKEIRVNVWKDLPLSVKGKRIGFVGVKYEVQDVTKDGVLKTYRSVSSQNEPYYLSDGPVDDLPYDKPKKDTQEVMEDLGVDTTEDDIRELKVDLMRTAHLYLLCAKAVETVIAPHVHMEEAQKQAATASLFISSERSGKLELISEKYRYVEKGVTKAKEVKKEEEASEPDPF